MQQVVAARSITITSDDNQLVGDTPLTLTASASGFVEGETVSIKGVFFYPGSSNYFGYTKKNDDTWIKNSDATIDQVKVIIGNWDGRLMLRADTRDSGYQGEGEYQVKVGYYYTTASGNLSSVNWSANTVTITFVEPDPTVTSTPTPSPHPTATISPSPTSTSTPRLPATATITRSLRQNPTRYPSTMSGILGIQDGADTPALTSNAAVQQIPLRKTPPLVNVLLVLGVGIALASFGIAMYQLPIWKNILEQQKNNTDT